MISAVGIRRPVLRYFGAKWVLAPWVISHFPAHRSYVEPFCGSCAVLLNKPRSTVETVSDLDGRLVNFFTQLRERTDELVRLLSLTPYARREFERALTPSDDPLDDARRFFVAAWMSIGGTSKNTKTHSWRYVKTVRDRTGRAPAGYWQLDHLYAVAERLMGVQIECRDALHVARHFDTPDTLTYLDPPYVHSTRSSPHNCYQHEMDDDAHRALADVAHELTGYCLVSGYESDLYRDLYEMCGWARLETNARANTNLKNVAPTYQGKTECLWLSPRTVAALKGGLFAPVGVS